MKSLLLYTYLLSGVLINSLVCQSVQASAAYIGVHSVDGLARANAGEVALASSAASISKNPALIMRLADTQISIGGSYVDSNWDVEHVTPYVEATELDALARDSVHNFGPRNVLLPGLYASHNFGQWGIGLSVSTFYGGLLDYADDDYRFTEIADDTALLSANTQLDMAYAFNSRLNIGVGLDLALGYSELNRHFGDLSSPVILNQPLYGLVDIIAQLQTQDGALGDVLKSQLPDVTAFLDPRKDLFEFRGHSYGVGWHAGLDYKFNSRLDLGLTYRSRLTHHYKGKYESDLPILPRIYGDLGTAGAERSAEFDLVQPAMVDAGLNFKLNARWQLHAGLSWQQWSDFQTFDINDDKGQRLFSKPMPHTNQWRYALGASFHSGPRWTWRWGVALDQSSASMRQTTITLPSSDRYWFSTGFNYVWDETTSIDVAFSYARNKTINNREKSLIADVVLEPFPDASSLNDALDIINAQFDLGAVGDLPINLPLNDVANSLYGESPFYEQRIEADLIFIGMQWNKRF